jgi:glutathione synthase/RimK-type ligase-like ATP-grasp enzyme
MVSCAFLTIADLGDFVSDDELAVVLLRERGWRVDCLPWDRPADWARYDLVVIRTTWDYHERPALFLDVLAQIERSGTPLYNPLALVRWNLDKNYLRDLESKGVPVVPTAYARRLASPDDLAAHFQNFGTDELILKPPVNVNAFNTFRVPRSDFETLFPQLKAVYGSRPYMAQPFMPAINTEGEFSLIYFNGQFSHAILKTPLSGDFRVQEEHGGLITAVTPGETLLAAGRRALNALPAQPLYARVDLVRSGEEFLIMELELIEPSLYLRMHPAAPERFANALASTITTP